MPSARLSCVYFKLSLNSQFCPRFVRSLGFHGTRAFGFFLRVSYPNHASSLHVRQSSSRSPAPPSQFNPQPVRWHASTVVAAILEMDSHGPADQFAQIAADRESIVHSDLQPDKGRSAAGGDMDRIDRQVDSARKRKRGRFPTSFTGNYMAWMILFRSALISITRFLRIVSVASAIVSSILVVCIRLSPTRQEIIFPSGGPFASSWRPAYRPRVRLRNSRGVRPVACLKALARYSRDPNPEAAATYTTGISVSAKSCLVRSSRTRRISSAGLRPRAS